MRVVLSGPALRDLEAIGDRIALDDPDRAFSYVRELRASAKGLGRFPVRFPLVAGHESSGMRRRLHGSYLIFYRIEQKQVTILRFVHGARNYEALLFPDD